MVSRQAATGFSESGDLKAEAFCEVNQYCVSQNVVLSVFLGLLLLSSPSFGAELIGKVVRVLDGDTIEVLHSQHPTRIRLSGIDCPEKGQAYGKKAKQATSVLAFGNEVMLQTFGKDKYKRIIGDVRLPDGTNLNQELVKQGWCWWYRKYAPGDTVLEWLESDAREARKGLWADPQPVPPWEWRKRK